MNYTYERQQYIDIVELHMHNRKVEAKGPPQARLDEDERLRYIKHQKEKLGIENRELLKTSGRAIVDGQLMKNMPVLEFNSVFRDITERDSVF